MEMFKIVSLNSEKVQNSLRTNNWLGLAEYLKDTFKVERNENGTPIIFEFSDDALKSLIHVLDIISNIEIWNNEINVLLTETFRALRNYSINDRIRIKLGNKDFLVIVDSFLSKFLNNHDVSSAHKCLLQLLLNLLNSNEEIKKNIKTMFYNKVCSYLLTDSVHIYEVSALFYNLSKEDSLTDKIYIEKIIEFYNSDLSNEYLHFIMEKIIQEDYFWCFYNEFSIKQRLILLQVLRETLIKGNIEITDEAVKTIIRIFLKSSDTIFQVTNKDKLDESYEVSYILEILSIVSSQEKYLNKLQENKDVIISAGVLLINIHRLGKGGNNCFSPIQHLSEVREPGESVKDHPAFGFKADLIRLIGNLCWKNRKMQDLARTAELIPIILDCCNIDARNPFIIQWCILTIRNLCDNNKENQGVIAGLHQEGTVSSDVLEELGLTLHSEGDNSLKIVSLDTLRNKRT